MRVKASAINCSKHKLKGPFPNNTPTVFRPNVPKKVWASAVQVIEWQTIGRRKNGREGFVRISVNLSLESESERSNNVAVIPSELTISNRLSDQEMPVQGSRSLRDTEWFE
jgi:hypothetical protein